ncbi:MAG: hypothetical protein Q8P20_04485 [bacterium]|nr:hypothetical protein [bacterium]
MEIPNEIKIEMDKISDEDIIICPITDDLETTDEFLGIIPEILKKLYILGEKLIAQGNNLVTASNQKGFDDEATFQVDDNNLAMQLMPLGQTVDSLSELFWLKVREHFDVPLGIGKSIAIRKDWTIVIYSTRPE